MTPKSLFQQPAAVFLSRDEAKSLTDRILSFSKADETRINIQSGWTGNTRYAGGQVTTSGDTSNTVVTVLCTVGKKRASATTNILDDESLHRTVDLAMRLARLSPDDPELMPELGPQQYQNINNYFDATANLRAYRDRARQLPDRPLPRRVAGEGTGPRDPLDRRGRAGRPRRR